jgi:hypothetical protein
MVLLQWIVSRHHLKTRRNERCNTQWQKSNEKKKDDSSNPNFCFKLIILNDPAC